MVEGITSFKVSLYSVILLNAKAKGISPIPNGMPRCRIKHNGQDKLHLSGLVNKVIRQIFFLFSIYFKFSLKNLFAAKAASAPSATATAICKVPPVQSPAANNPGIDD